MDASLTKMTAFERLLGGDVAALARAISLLEVGGQQSDALAARLRGHAGQARVIGFTGPPGAGKSTLISAYVAALRARAESVAILAVDPSSPLSGGAVLGDRTRMGEHSTDPGVFIRSVAARGHLGGLALSIPGILDAVDAAGWPTIILETVGAGQSETEIVEFADVKVVLNAPGLGDDVQAIKAGILEIADVLVVKQMRSAAGGTHGPSTAGHAGTAQCRLPGRAHRGNIGNQARRPDRPRTCDCQPAQGTPTYRR